MPQQPSIVSAWHLPPITAAASVGKKGESMVGHGVETNHGYRAVQRSGGLLSRLSPTLKLSLLPGMTRLSPERDPGSLDLWGLSLG